MLPLSFIKFSWIRFRNLSATPGSLVSPCPVTPGLCVAQAEAPSSLLAGHALRKTCPSLPEEHSVLELDGHTTLPCCKRPHQAHRSGTFPILSFWAFRLESAPGTHGESLENDKLNSWDALCEFLPSVTTDTTLLLTLKESTLSPVSRSPADGRRRRALLTHCFQTLPSGPSQTPSHLETNDLRNHRLSLIVIVTPSFLLPSLHSLKFWILPHDLNSSSVLVTIYSDFNIPVLLWNAGRCLVLLVHSSIPDSH